VQQQLESMRLQNEALRKQLQENASRPAQLAATDYSKSTQVTSADIKS
jgi:hypothetical protein